MQLMASSYGKGRVRIMRVDRSAAEQQVRELSVSVMLHGAFDRAYTDADNGAVVATDTIKNIVNLVAGENVAAEAEAFCEKLSQRFLDRYAQVNRVGIQSWETRWNRVVIAGGPHPHGFVLDANGRPTVQLDRTRKGATLRSGIDGFTFMKSTGSGWADYIVDEYTTLAPTQDRIAATSMTASWLWSALPDDVTATNARALRTMLEVFVTTHSHSVQDSLFRMGGAVLAAVPGIAEISLSCPNKHYLPIDLARFGVLARHVFTPTDEPHGLIECTVTR